MYKSRFWWKVWLMGASYKDKNSEISYKYCLNLEYLEIKYCD